MKKDDFALALGNQILNSIQKIQEEKKHFGRSTVVPIRFKSEDPEGQQFWTTSVEVKMPHFATTIVGDDGLPETKFITMAEYYGWTK